MIWMTFPIRSKGGIRLVARFLLVWFAAVKRKRDAMGGVLNDPRTRLFSVDTSYFKDKLTRAMNVERGAPLSWLLHSQPHEEYLRQITAEYKVLVRNTKGIYEEQWRKRPHTGGNHWFDCEVYALAAAEMLQVYLLSDDTEPSAFITELIDAQPRTPTPQPGKGRIGRREGFIRRRDR